MAAQLFGGSSTCSYGCLGYGDCAEACPYDAIKICEGVAQVDPLLCRACKLCVATCPKRLITLTAPARDGRLPSSCHNDRTRRPPQGLQGGMHRLHDGA